MTVRTHTHTHDTKLLLRNIQLQLHPSDVVLLLGNACRDLTSAVLVNSDSFPFARLSEDTHQWVRDMLEVINITMLDQMDIKPMLTVYSMCSFKTCIWLIWEQNKELSWVIPLKPLLSNCCVWSNKMCFVFSKVCHHYCAIRLERWRKCTCWKDWMCTWEVSQHSVSTVEAAAPLSVQ